MNKVQLWAIVTDECLWNAVATAMECYMYLKGGGEAHNYSNTSRVLLTCILALQDDKLHWCVYMAVL